MINSYDNVGIGQSAPMDTNPALEAAAQCYDMRSHTDIKGILRQKADRLVQRAGTMRHLADSLPDNLQEDVKTMILDGISN